MNRLSLPLAAQALAAVLASCALSACTTRGVYDAGQAWRQERCNKLTDMDQRQRCMKEAQQPYDDYQKDADKAKTSPR